MLDRVLETIRRHNMFGPEHTVGVAVSGGADSVCLLHVLKESGFRLAVIHLNHKLRGPESDADAAFVGELAASLDLPLHQRDADIASAAGNLEAAGRSARHGFFSDLLKAGQVDRIATGHTRSDQAETVLFRLLRGAGTAGLTGILPSTSEGITRPLIDCTRDEVRAFLRERGWAWREDATNQDRNFVRNRIRHDLLPLLREQFSPAVEHILAATAITARAEEDYWSAETRRLGERLFSHEDGGIILRADDIVALHPAVARRVVRRAISEVKGCLTGIDLSHVEAILALTRQGEGHGRTQAPGIDVIRSYEWLRIAEPRKGSRFEGDYSVPVALQPGDPPLVHGAICLLVLDLPEPADVQARYNLVSELDWDLLRHAPLELRNWHPGDTFQPPGRPLEKIKSLFLEARIPLWRRHAWPVLTCGMQIVWSRGFGVAPGYERTKNTRRVLRVDESNCSVSASKH